MVIAKGLLIFRGYVRCRAWIGDYRKNFHGKRHSKVLKGVHTRWCLTEYSNFQFTLFCWKNRNLDNPNYHEQIKFIQSNNKLQNKKKISHSKSVNVFPVNADRTIPVNATFESTTNMDISLEYYCSSWCVAQCFAIPSH